MKKPIYKIWWFWLIILTICIATVFTISNNDAFPNNPFCEHIESKWIIDKGASVDATGKKHIECIECGKVLQTQIIPEIQLSESEIIEKLKYSVVKVVCYDYDKKTELSQGSGFFIDNRGTFVTNAHVVEGCYYIKITNYMGATYDVDVMYTYNDTYSDYAICKASNCYSSKPVEFATSANIGDTVYALGFPNGANKIITTSGKITDANASEGSKDFYLNTAFIDHGSSGGVLVNAKGRVLGITTGQFSNGDYAALKYNDFKYDVERTHVGFKEPLEYFHRVEEVWLASYNVDDYFDIIVNGRATSNTSVSYTVVLRLKDKYAHSKIMIDSLSLRVTVKLDTKFQYTEYLSYGGSFNKTDTDSEYLYFYFYSIEDMIIGDTAYASSSIFIPYGSNYYNMRISYDVDFFGANGTILIYD